MLCACSLGKIGSPKSNSNCLRHLQDSGSLWAQALLQRHQQPYACAIDGCASFEGAQARHLAYLLPQQGS